MAKPRLERLTLTKFRGCSHSTTFEFDTKKEIILIFGENGTGKSSIADALDFLCNNDFGSLRHREGSIGHKHIVAFEAAANELEVSMKFGGNEWHARLRGQKPHTVFISPAPISPAPNSPPPAFVLRRADITRVMESRPAERYKARQTFITVPNVEKAEKELRDAHRAAKNAWDDAARALGNAHDALEQFWRAEGAPGHDAVEWAGDKVIEETHKLETRLEAAKQLLQCFDRTTVEYAQWQAAHADVARATDELRQASDAVQQAVATLTDHSELLVTLLDSAFSYLQVNTNADLPCPVCGKRATHTALVERVERERAQLTEIRQLAHLRALRQEALSQAQGALTIAEQNVVQLCPDLAMRLSLATKTLGKGVDWRRLNRARPDALDAIGPVLDQLTRNRPLFETTIADVQKTLNQRTAIRSYLHTIATHTQDAHAKQAVANRLRAMLDIVESQRKAYVSNLIHAISAEVNHLYTRIHPAEQLGRPTFNVKRHTAGSLELKADFADASNVAPGAYYSEAHLDTLGLCVYLALAKHAGAGNSLVVLDDVLTSVDDAHLDRIIAMLNEEAKNFGHLIITTHSRAWFNTLRMAKGMNADLFELHGWSLHGGIHHSRSPLYVEELRQTLMASKLDRQAVASKAGILLEQLLDELAFRYECRVRHRRNCTLGDFADAISGNKAINALRSVQTHPDGTVQDYAIMPLILACTDFTWVRNEVGAHFNLHEATIPDAMIRGFARAVLTLADALVCPSCQQLPTKDKRGEHWQCGGGCGKTLLHPLRAAAH